jgi:hypothetical protein
MTDLFSSTAATRDFEEFEYRLLYLRTSYYSDERITVGVVAAAPQCLEARFVSSIASIEIMTRLLGEDGVEQYQHAAGELRRLLPKIDHIDRLTIPSDLLLAGEKITAFSKDRRGFLTGVLDAASCLVRVPSSRGNDVMPSSSAGPFLRELFDEVSRLSPTLATSIFNQKINVEGKTIDVPILGRNIFGAPVSFISSAQIMKAEAYVAKFQWLRSYIQRQPKVYVLTVDEAKNIEPTRNDAISELIAVARSSNVDVEISDSPVELASSVIRDEAIQRTILTI